MIQDIIVYVIIAGVIIRTLFAVFRFFRPSGNRAPACKGCSTCSIEKSRLVSN